MAAARLHHFCRSLRAAGLPIGPDQVADALVATCRVGVERPADVHAALRAVLVKNPGHFTLFEQLYRVYFRKPGLLERLVTLPAPGGRPAAGSQRVAEALAGASGAPERRALSERDGRGTASRIEALRRKDFEQMSLDEQRLASQIVRRGLQLLRPVTTRRLVPDRRGHRFDGRRTIHRMLKSGGDPVQFVRQRRRRRPPDVVLLCDISGSMKAYVRAFLLFAHALAARQPGVQAFVFGTRLSAVTRRLRTPDADHALHGIGTDVVDWDGGTRIAACIGQFNRVWSRRVLARSATVVLLSDGLERDAGSDLAFQMQRLRRSCKHLLWLNPLLRYPEFEPLAGGIRHMLPHVDRHLPAHNVDSLLALCRALGVRDPLNPEAAIR